MEYEVQFTNGLTVKTASVEELTSYGPGVRNGLRWSTPFTLPHWLQLWWSSFGNEYDPCIKSVWQQDHLIGLSPLVAKDRTAEFLGSDDLCDYLDFICVDGEERKFFSALLRGLRESGIDRLALRSIRPDSLTFNHLMPLARELNLSLSQEQQDLSLEFDLPGSWDEYLASLSKKERHEVRRKVRRLEKAGVATYTTLDRGAVSDSLDLMLHLFTESRQDKASFMTPEREQFFRSMVCTMSEEGPLKVGSLTLNDRTVAMVLYFDFHDKIYLYNSCYDPSFRDLSVGLICKIFCIKEAIETGKKTFDFLKGGEHYKYRLGGKEVPLYACDIVL